MRKSFDPSSFHLSCDCHNFRLFVKDIFVPYDICLSIYQLQWKVVVTNLTSREGRFSSSFLGCEKSLSPLAVVRASHFLSWFTLPGLPCKSELFKKDNFIPLPHNAVESCGQLRLFPKHIFGQVDLRAGCMQAVTAVRFSLGTIYASVLG